MYRNDIMDMFTNMKEATNSIEKVRILPNYQVTKALFTGLVDVSMPKEIAGSVVSCMEIKVNSIEDKELVDHCVDCMISIIYCMYQTFVSDYGYPLADKMIIDMGKHFTFEIEM
jgi:hypothetical protein